MTIPPPSFFPPFAFFFFFFMAFSPNLQTDQQRKLMSSDSIALGSKAEGRSCGTDGTRELVCWAHLNGKCVAVHGTRGSCLKLKRSILWPYRMPKCTGVSFNKAETTRPDLLKYNYIGIYLSSRARLIVTAVSWQLKNFKGSWIIWDLGKLYANHNKDQNRTQRLRSVCRWCCFALQLI